MILVVGATGSLGTRIVEDLRARGEQVRALVRREPGEALRRSGAELVGGDLRDPASLAHACRGVRAVVTTATVSKSGDDSIENVDLLGNANLIEAARGAGVEHVVFTSTLSAAEDSPVPLFRAKAASERRLRDSGVAYTILHPNAFMDVWFGMLIEGPVMAGQPVTLIGESRRRHAFVAEQDVASFAVSALYTPAGRNTTLVIGGPEAVTWRDVVAAYEAAMSRSIEVRSIPPGESIPGVSALVSGIAAAFETFDSPVPMAETATTYGVHLTSVAAFARSRSMLRGAIHPLAH